MALHVLAIVVQTCSTLTDDSVSFKAVGSAARSLKHSRIYSITDAHAAEGHLNGVELSIGGLCVCVEGWRVIDGVEEMESHPRNQQEVSLHLLLHQRESFQE